MVAAPAELPPLRLLVAEDNEVNRLVLKTLLEQVGLQPRFACNGVEALDPAPARSLAEAS